MTTIENSLPDGLTRVEGNESILSVESPQLPLPYDLRYDLIRAAHTSPFAEVCGFITSRMKPFFVLNTADDPRNNFHMSLPNLRRAVELIAAAGDEILGVFHSHPGGSPYPSERDLAGWPNSDLNWRYFIVTPDNVYEYVKA